MKNLKLYHYTTVERLDEIVKSGQINLATKSTSHKKEKAVAWVSSNEEWENTATKIVNDNYSYSKQMTFSEQLEHFGCARICVKSDGFLTWASLKYIAKMNMIIANSMETVGIDCGANPSEWFGSLSPIKKDKWLTAEIYKDGKWIIVKSFNL